MIFGSRSKPTPENLTLTQVANRIDLALIESRRSQKPEAIEAMRVRLARLASKLNDMIRRGAEITFPESSEP